MQAPQCVCPVETGIKIPEMKQSFKGHCGYGGEGMHSCMSYILSASIQTHAFQNLLYFVVLSNK